ncbi:MAG: DUF4231 domain-containing protein [Metamycoplasmataceae bacterium]
MNIGKFKIEKYGDNVNYYIGLYRRKLIILKMFVTITNIIFPSIAVLLVIISTLNLAGDEYETNIAGADYIILAAIISGTISLINSLISLFLLKEKITYYNKIYYKLIIEKQRYELDGEKYSNVENYEDKKRVFENELFSIITGYIRSSEKESE